MWVWAAAVGGLIVLAQLVPPGSAAAQSIADTLSALTGGGGSAAKPSGTFVPARPTTTGARQTIFGLQAPTGSARVTQPVNITAPRAAAPVIVGVAAPAPYAPYNAPAAPQVGYSNPEAPQAYQPSPAAPTPAPAPVVAPAPVGYEPSGGSGRAV